MAGPIPAVKYVNLAIIALNKGVYDGKHTKYGLQEHLRADPTVLRVLSNEAARLKAQKAEGDTIFLALMIITTLTWLLNLMLYLL